MDGHVPDSSADRFPRPSRLTIGLKLGSLITHKLAETSAGYPLTDGQKTELAKAGWFPAAKQDEVHSLSLLEADAFRVTFVSGQDPQLDSEGNEVVDDGNFAVSIYLERDGSPFVFDADMEKGATTNEYTLLVGPDAPPVLVNQDFIEDAASSGGSGSGYSHGNWAHLAMALETLGREVAHELNDQDCDNALSAVAATLPDIPAVIRDYGGAVEGFDQL